MTTRSAASVASDVVMAMPGHTGSLAWKGRFLHEAWPRQRGISGDLERGSKRQGADPRWCGNHCSVKYRKFSVEAEVLMEAMMAFAVASLSGRARAW